MKHENCNEKKEKLESHNELTQGQHFHSIDLKQYPRFKVERILLAGTESAKV